MILTIAIIIICLFWIIIEFKNILFWIYLWQLKNYHIGRFKSHFSTEKGKKIFLNKFFAVKLIAIPLFFLINFLPLLVILGEGLFVLIKRQFIKPSLTKKTIILLLANIIFFIGILTYLIITYAFENILLFAFILLLINILSPLIISLIILILQPITVFLKLRIINKAKKKRKKLNNLTVIGITGSYGKSSTKEFLYAILSSKFKNVKKTPENINSELGISEYILNNLTEEDEYFICEMGAYNKGGIKLLCEIADPQIGILTGINNQHLATFGNQENIVKAKFELIEYVPNFAVLNWDNFLIKNYKLNKTNIYKYSYKEQQDIFAEDIRVSKDHLSFKIKGEEIEVNLLGKQNVSNLLASMLVAEKLGMSLEEIKKSLKNISPKQGGMEKIGNFIDATYSSNANGVIAHLEFIQNWNGKKVIVMPCLIELGKEARRIHEEIGKKIDEVCDLAIITTKDYFNEIKKQGGDKVIFSNNADDIIKILEKYNSENDIILLESRVPKKIIKYIKK